MPAPIKIKSAQIFYQKNNLPYVYFGNITGYGDTIFNISGEVNSSILNPTGIQPAIYYKTGLLTGIVPSGQGSFTWTDIEVNTTGEINHVFLNYATGYKQASGLLYINDDLLIANDIININEVAFAYDPEADSIFTFSSSSDLINKLNSGATGAYTSEDNGVMETLVGLTGYKNNNLLVLFAYAQSGENGNNNTLTKSVTNFNSVFIPNKFFNGGLTLRPPIQNVIGRFIDNLTITAENSGFYSFFRTVSPIIGSLPGIVWEDNFNKNYYITTGLRDLQNPDLPITDNLLIFNSGLNQYTGYYLIPRNSSYRVPRVLNIDISKPNPYNISGNIFKYTLSGNNFIYSDNLEG